MTTIKPITIHEALSWEIRSVKWTGWIRGEVFKAWVVAYFAWKVRRKYARYLVSMKGGERG